MNLSKLKDGSLFKEARGGGDGGRVNGGKVNIITRTPRHLTLHLGSAITFSTNDKNFSRHILNYFSYFSQKIGYELGDNLHEMSKPK